VRNVQTLVLLGVCLVLSLGSVPLSAQRHPNAAKGIIGTQSHGTGLIDTINYFNGNLTVSVPLGQAFPLSTSLSYGFALHYNSNTWDIEKVYHPTNPNGPCPQCVTQYTAAFPDRRSNAGMGWVLTMGRLWAPGAETNKTGHWVYETPDGSDHRFFGTLHDGETAASEVFYTRDGSYLRLRYDSATGQRLVEFPGGAVHEFEPGPGGVDAMWRLKRIRDRFTNTAGAYTNWVSIDYVPNSTGAIDWLLTDSAGRSHRIRYKTITYDMAPADFVDVVELDAFGTDVAKYILTYEHHSAVRHCADDDNSQFGGTPTFAPVEALKSIRLENKNAVDLGYTHTFEYLWGTQLVCDDYAGLLENATLPSGATIAWIYDPYHLPTVSADEWYFDTAYGVTSRTVTDPVSGTGTWTYGVTTDRPYDDEDTGERPRELKNTVMDPAGNKTEYFFNVAVEIGDPWEDGHYGLPFSPIVTDGTLTNPRYLTSRQYKGANLLQRESFVRYEDDGGYSTREDAKNMRMNSTRVDFEDDKVDGIATWITTDLTNFDGHGHYRRSEQRASFTSSPVRATVTGYNPGRGEYGKPEYSPLASTAPWILDTYSDTNVIEDSYTIRAMSCFGSNGQVLRTRALASTETGPNGVVEPGRTDVIEVYTYDDHGNVQQRDTYGGDGANLDLGADLCNIALPSLPTYRNLYTYAGGTLATAKYRKPNGNVDMPFFSVNLEIDTGTGKPSRSYDTAGRYVSFTYDAAGRPRLTSPQGDASTLQTYAAASTAGGVFTPGTVSLQSGTIEAQEQFDGLDRPWRSKRLMPDGTWSVKETKRDLMNRVLAESEYETLVFSQNESDFVPSQKTTYTNFDAFGRAQTITTPDGNVVSMAFKGMREITRTYHVATSATSESAVSVTEELDSLGRVYRVRENSGSATAWVETTYAYDAAGRLVEATTKNAQGQTQIRTFEYDGRGFLLNDTQPESGTNAYEYDARGHLMTRIGPTAVLRFDYDKAERPLNTLQDGLGWLVENVYDRANSVPGGVTDYSNGKLDYARRHNHQPLLGGDVLVQETYVYAGRGGRLSKKTTQVIGTSSFAGETFSETYAYDPIGALASVTYPECSACPASAKPARTVTNTYTSGYLTSVGRPNAPGHYASALTYHPNTLLASIQHTNANGSPGPLYQQHLSPSDPLARPHKIEVTNFCTSVSIGTPQAQPASIQTGSSATLTVSAPGASSITWYDSAGNLAGSGAQISVSPAMTTSYYARAVNGNCTIDSAAVVVTVTACAAPGTTISAAASITASATGTASIPAGAATYSWTITNGTIIGATNGNSITYRAGCSGSVTLNVTATASCGASQNGSKSIPINRPTISVTGTATIAQGGTATLTATLTGTAPFLVTWSDGNTQGNVNATSVTRGASPLGTTTYTANATDQNGCAAISSGSAVVTVTPPAPVMSAAYATGNDRVFVNWNFSGSADTFEIERYDRAPGAPAGYRVVGAVNGTVTSFTDLGIPSSTAYLYRVVAVKSGVRSAPSGVDLATTILFTDDTILAQQTSVAVVHFTQLRTAVNAVRTLGQLSAYAFTDPALTVRTTQVKRVHLAELRTALDQARAALSLPAWSYADPTVPPGVFIRAVHVSEVRGGVK